ncbi:MAG TPA: hypothetical protein VFN80_04830 [Acidothermaceae bacterium]|jgi:hypothetical protein|nr:hypothetical protein [Acidothermaceae bacterium]
MASGSGSRSREAEPALYIGAIPRHATGNGFSASTWVALEDLHASAAPPLLAVLADAGIPAFANAVAPAQYHGAGHRGRHQLVRLWVEAHQVTRARQVVVSATGSVRL